MLNKIITILIIIFLLFIFIIPVDEEKESKNIITCNKCGYQYKNKIKNCPRCGHKTGKRVE